MARRLLATLLMWISAAPAWAQEAGDRLACREGGDCDRIYQIGAWGLIALGAVFLLIGLLPARVRERPPEEQGTVLSRALRVMLLEGWVEKEQSGWRRLQWVFIGAFLCLIGASYVLGWR